MKIKKKKNLTPTSYPEILLTCFFLYFQYNDVAMLTLERPAVYTAQVRPVCLDKSQERYAGEMVTVAGWGSMYEGMLRSVKEYASLKQW